MLKRIMFPTDFSMASEKIYNCIPVLREIGMEEALLVHIVDERDDRDTLEYTKLAIDALTKDKKRFENEGVRVKTIVRTGIPFIELNEIAKEEKASLVLITSHGKSMIEKMLLGSVTENFIYHSAVPVLLEKVQVFEWFHQEECCDVVLKNTFKHILYPTDWSECANQVLEQIKDFKRFGTESITVLHVMDVRNLKYHTEKKIEEFERIDLEKLSAVKGELEKSGFKVDVKLSAGIPFKEIKRAAREDDITLIAMGVHGKGFIKEALLGSTAEWVTKLAFKPVLLLCRAQED